MTPKHKQIWSTRGHSLNISRWRRHTAKLRGEVTFAAMLEMQRKSVHLVEITRDDHATAAPTLRDEVSESEIDSAWSDLQARMAAEPDHIERQRAQFAALRHRPAGDPWGANSPPAALNDWATKWAQPADLPSKPPPLPRWLKVTAGIVFVYLVVLIVMALAGQPPVH